MTTCGHPLPARRSCELPVGHRGLHGAGPWPVRHEPCPITGDALLTEHHGQLRWEQADPAIHITTELLDQLSARGLAFLTDRYQVGEICPHQPDTRHARRKP